jgi:DNA-binding NarL/FixJ family response regulator
MVRQSLRTILQAFANVLIVGEAITGADAVAGAERLQPHIVLMDINLPLVDGITATRMIKTRCPHIAVIGLTCHTPGELGHAMMKAGAFRVVAKQEALNLCEVIKRAVECSSLSNGTPTRGSSLSNVPSAGIES